MKTKLAALALAGLTLAGCSQEKAPAGQTQGASNPSAADKIDAEQYIAELNARVESETVLKTRNPVEIEVDKTIRIAVPNIFTQYSTLGVLPACDGTKVVETNAPTPLEGSYCRAIGPAQTEWKTGLSVAQDNYSQAYKEAGKAYSATYKVADEKLSNAFADIREQDLPYSEKSTLQSAAIKEKDAAMHEAYVAKEEATSLAYQTLKGAKNETMGNFRDALLPIQTDYLRANTGDDGRTIIQVALNGTPATTVLAHKDVDRIVSLPESASDLLVTLPGLYPHCPAENASRINPTTPDQIYCAAISDIETTSLEKKQAAEEAYTQTREQAQATYDEAINAIDPTLPYYDRLTAQNEARSARDTIFVEASSNKTVASAKTGIAYDEDLNKICLEYLRASSGKDGKFVIEFVLEQPREHEAPTTSLE